MKKLVIALSILVIMSLSMVIAAGTFISNYQSEAGVNTLQSQRARVWGPLPKTVPQQQEEIQAQR